MSNGWTGKRLRIDLSTGMIKTESIAKTYCETWLGGRGFNSELLYREVGVNVDPLSPESRLIFGVGPLTGTFAPSSARTTITAKSPLGKIHGFGDSNVGGHWGAELKFAGYDQVVIQGKAIHPVYLWIENERVEIRDARHLWGKLIPEADADD